MFIASLIISVYKNIRFLRVILDSLALQTEQNFEIIISEDGANNEMKQFVASYTFRQPWQHLTQPDEGWRKNKAMNRALQAARSDYHIYIDGDCILHPRFIEMHLRYASPTRILAGKRVKLNQELSEEVIKNPLMVNQLQRILLPRLFINKNGIKFIEEGIFLSPDGMAGFIPGLRKQKILMGSNMSFSREQALKINGFDEDYDLPATGEDADLSWRFDLAGYAHFSLRNLAVQYHLWHPENWTDQSENKKMMEQKMNKKTYFCLNGLHKSN